MALFFILGFSALASTLLEGWPSFIVLIGGVIAAVWVYDVATRRDPRDWL